MGHIINSLKARKLLPKRTRLSNKTDGGHVYIVAGGSEKMGAALLSSLAATKTGAGYTHLVSKFKKIPWFDFPDFLFQKLEISELKKIDINKNYAIGVGPGLGVNLKTKRILNFLIKNSFEKVILDADALTVLSEFKKLKLNSEWILTPHEGELSRLLNVSSEKINLDKEKYLKMAVNKYNCTVLLKGNQTLILSPNSEIIKVKSKTTALSKAGTGDVLLGIIAALRAQGLSSIDCAALGAFIHCESAYNWQKKTKSDSLSLRPTDLIDFLPFTIQKMRSLKNH